MPMHVRPAGGPHLQVSCVCSHKHTCMRVLSTARTHTHAHTPCSPLPSSRNKTGDLGRAELVPMVRTLEGIAQTGPLEPALPRTWPHQHSGFRLPKSHSRSFLMTSYLARNTGPWEREECFLWKGGRPCRWPWEGRQC